VTRQKRNLPRARVRAAYSRGTEGGEETRAKSEAMTAGGGRGRVALVFFPRLFLINLDALRGGVISPSLSPACVYTYRAKKGKEAARCLSGIARERNGRADPASRFATGSASKRSGDCSVFDL